MSRAAKRSGIGTAAIGTFVVGWGAYLLRDLHALGMTAEPSVELLSIGAYLLGGIGLLLTGIATAREPDPDARVYRWLDRLSYGSFGLITLGVLVPHVA